ncbi:MAG: ATP-binding protein [bacterium]|nr:ATP-binding protein [bacterium]
MAHKGILFFDELTEFPREVLEVLRQPLEDKKVRISRVTGTVEYPAEFMFLASMNPCKCGYYQDPERECSCSLNDIKRYQSKLSGPLLDRIDMILEVPREKIENLLEAVHAESSSSLRNKVRGAWTIQQKRFAKSRFSNNANIDNKHLHEFVVLDNDSKNFLKEAAERLVLSPRLVHKFMKLARTIADLEGKEDIEVQHLSEAMQYRSKNFFIE